MMISYDIYDRFYNGVFSIASKNDLDDQHLLLATVGRYIKNPVELCGSIILLCRTMSSRWNCQIRFQQSNLKLSILSVSCEFEIFVVLLVIFFNFSIF
jgi:hypothetical protein